MNISKEYGPQLDASDGTCGHLQLVKRWVIVTGDGHFWGAQQGQYTRATKEEADKRLSDIIASNAAWLIPVGLRVAPWWCWPTHFDPAISCETEG